MNRYKWFKRALVAIGLILLRDSAPGYLLDNIDILYVND